MPVFTKVWSVIKITLPIVAAIYVVVVLAYWLFSDLNLSKTEVGASLTFLLLSLAALAYEHEAVRKRKS